MENVLGLLKVHVIRGVNLAIRDTSSSDPYLILRMGKQKLKTRVMKKNLNPEWDEHLTLSVTDPSLPLTIIVYDRDWFSRDDHMGDADFNIGPFFEAIRAQEQLQELTDGTIITKIQPTRQNCLSEESKIVWNKGKIVQNIFLRLQHVERGEVELQLEWVNIHGNVEP